MLWIMLLGCTAPPEADAPLEDALAAVYAGLFGEPDALARDLRNVERRIYEALPVAAEGVGDRSVRPRAFTPAELADVSPRPEGPDPTEASGVASAYLSAFAVDAHVGPALVVDHVAAGLEPQNDVYVRSFLEGADCWAARGCEVLGTTQEITKPYPLIQPIDYRFFKTYRWVDLGLGDPQGDGGERWAIASRSWNPETFVNRDGAVTIWQSYVLEVWLPRDGRGFTWAAAGSAPADERYVDSVGGGTLRLVSVYSTVDAPITSTKEQQDALVPGGSQRNFEAHEAWLEAQ